MSFRHVIIVEDAVQEIIHLPVGTEMSTLIANIHGLTVSFFDNNFYFAITRICLNILCTGRWENVKPRFKNESPHRSAQKHASPCYVTRCLKRF